MVKLGLQGLAAAAGVAIVAAGAAFGATLLPSAQPEPTVVVEVAPIIPSDAIPEPTARFTPPAPVVELAPEPEPAPPVKCPSGTRANAVDGAGNESACEPLGPSGQPCVAYNDQNVCTEYLEP